MDKNNIDKPDISQPEESSIRPLLSPNFDKLNVHNWLYDKPTIPPKRDIVEIKFKNTRKGFYHNINNLNLRIGDIVAVEGSPGHDIGTVSLTSEVIHEQLKKNRLNIDCDFKRIYRKAKQSDIDKWKEAVALEHKTMLESRKLARDMGLNMKIGDVEYQGDNTKAIFYYIADERIDFRQLIIVLAERYKIRIEMRQIGARQEAGRIGGIGACGRELCCSTWMGNFISVSTNAARAQELSLNPQKLAGQCSKLKCCLNYELDSYLDTRRDFPSPETILKTKEGKAIHQKTDVYKSIMWYALDNENRNQIVPLTIDRVRQIIELNRKGIIPDKLIDNNVNQTLQKQPNKIDYQNVVGQDSLDRFTSHKQRDKENKRSKNKKQHDSNKNNVKNSENRNKNKNSNNNSQK